MVVGIALSHVKLISFLRQVMLEEYRKHSDMERLSPFVPVVGIVQRRDCCVTSKAKSQDAGPYKHGVLGSLMQRSLFWEAVDSCQV